MKRYKDTGLIFKQHNINESDRILSILTRFHGRVDAIAKGVRKITSHKAGSLDIADLSRFYFAVGKNLDIITEVKLINDFTELKKKLDSTFTVLYICELIDKFTIPGEKEKEIFDLTISLFTQLSMNSNSMLIRSYELKLLSMKGYEPNTDSCINCEKKLTTKDNLYISRISPGFICGCKNRHLNKDDKISSNSVKIIKYLKNNPIYYANRLNINRIYDKEVKNITSVWIESVIEKKIESKRFL